MSGQLGDLLAETAAFDAAVRVLPEPPPRPVRHRPGRLPKIIPPQGSLPLAIVETPPPARPRKPRPPRPALRRQLPLSDLGGAGQPPTPDPLLLVELTKGLGPIATRSSPIRDAILAFLTEPRRAVDIALHIRRTVPIATGHLAAMQRLGLVKRIGRATYALASYAGGPLNLGARRSGSGSELRARLRTLLVHRRSLQDLSDETDEAPPAVFAALHDMWLSGTVTGDRSEGYQLVSAIRAQ
jgi:hypothetical protein